MSIVERVYNNPDLKGKLLPFFFGSMIFCGGLVDISLLMELVGVYGPAKYPFFRVLFETLIVLSSLSMTVFTDPGVSSEWTPAVLLSPDDTNGADDVASLVGTVGMEYKFCSRCESTRPPRSFHCKRCGRCILRLDHHCFIIDCCIGYHNQKFFILFMLWGLLMSVDSLGIILRYIYNYGTQEGYSVIPSLSVSRIAFLFGWVFLFAISALGCATLSCFQIYLLCKNMTTVEFTHSAWCPELDRGLLKNTRVVFGTGSPLLWPLPLPPTRGPSVCAGSSAAATRAEPARHDHFDAVDDPTLPPNSFDAVDDPAMPPTHPRDADPLLLRV
eukprot:Rmarinus@m.23172